MTMRDSNYDIISENAMLEYIRETPSVLQGILDHRKQYSREFVEKFIQDGYEKLTIIGSGTSYHGALTTRAFAERTLNLPIDANYPTCFVNFTSVFDRKTLVLGISQGGESKSTINGLEYAKSKGCYTVSLTEDGKDSVLAKHSDMALQLMCGSEHAGPKTKGYQATMMTIVILALETGLAKGSITQEKYDEIVARLQKTIDNLNSVIENSIEWYNRNREDFLQGKRLIVVGYDNNYGNMMEGRLKLEEAIRYGVEGYEMEEFMHGIYHSIDEGVHIIYLAQQAKVKERAIRLRNFMHDYTPHEFMIGNFTAEEAAEAKNLSMNFVDDEEFCIFEYIIPLQCLAFFLSKDLGINANVPKIKNFHYLMGSK